MGESKISRFTSWEEIFPDSKEADRQYYDLLDGFRQKYQSNNSLASEQTEVDPGTGQTVTVFRRTFDGYTAIQRLVSGNVRMHYVDTKEITPEAGNKNHEWTYDDITSMAGAIRQRYESAKDLSEDGANRFRLQRLCFHLEGKPACMEWEETMLHNKKFRQRIGYHLYYGQVLIDARVELSHE